MRCRLAFAVLLPILLLRASADDLHDRFDRAVKQLRSDDASERDRGEAEIEAIAKESPDLVRPLAEDADAEVKARALRVLKRHHLLPETPAEALFRKVEEKYAGAKTVQYRATIEFNVDGIDDIMVLDVAAKTGNLFRFEGTSSAKVKPIKVVCDGNTVSRAPRWDDLSTGRARKTVEGGSAIVRGGVVRTGLLEGVLRLHRPDPPELGAEFTVENLSSEPDEKVEGRIATVLSYTVLADGQEPWQEKVWIDAVQNVLLKRTGTSREGKTVMETYSDTKFDEDIPDETFALPKEK